MINQKTETTLNQARENADASALAASQMSSASQGDSMAQVLQLGLESAPRKNAYAAILAGGSGTRMGITDKPKQFLMLGSKPILAHTVEKFCTCEAFDAVLVMCPSVWLQQTRDLLEQYCAPWIGKILVLAGGATRNDTVMNAVLGIQENFPVDKESIIVTHDAVRPFVSYRIIAENLQAARTYGACDTVIPASDTIVESLNGTEISAIPNRSNYYQGQTPQSFNLYALDECLRSLSEDEKALLTDACKVFVLREKAVSLVMGDVSNMKITYPQDLRVAQALLGAFAAGAAGKASEEAASMASVASTASVAGTAGTAGIADTASTAGTAGTAGIADSANTASAAGFAGCKTNEGV